MCTRKRFGPFALLHVCYSVRSYLSPCDTPHDLIYPRKFVRTIIWVSESDSGRSHRSPFVIPDDLTAPLLSFRTILPLPFCHYGRSYRAPFVIPDDLTAPLLSFRTILPPPFCCLVYTHPLPLDKPGSHMPFPSSIHTISSRLIPYL